MADQMSMQFGQGKGHQPNLRYVSFGHCLASGARAYVIGRPIQFYPIFAVLKCMRVFSLFMASNYLHDSNVPLTVYLDVVLFFAMVTFLLLQKPWRSPHGISGRQWARICLHGVCFTVTLLLWNLGLKHCGPLRTILFDNSDGCFLFFFGICFGSQFFDSTKLKAATGMIFAYALLTIRGEVSRHGSNPGGHTFYFYMFPVSEDLVGTLALILSSLLSAIHRKDSSKLGVEIGGAKRLQSLTVAIAFFFLMPIAAWSYAGTPKHLRVEFFPTSSLFVMLMTTVSVVFHDFYLETMLAVRSDKKIGLNLGVVISFVLASILDLAGMLGHTTTSSFLTTVCFIILAVGTHYLKASRPSGEFDGNDMPYYAASTSIIRKLFKNIYDDRLIRRKFSLVCGFLVIMLIQLVGAHSLGNLSLVADTCYTLLDVGSLITAIVATSVMKWKPTPHYTYGFGRIEVLCRFFLEVFQVFMVLYLSLEAVELFFDPPNLEDVSNTFLVFLLSCLTNLAKLVLIPIRGSKSRKLTEDAAKSGVLFVSCLSMYSYNSTTVDAFATLAISAFLWRSVRPRITESLFILLQRAPGIDSSSLESAVESVKEVKGVLGYREPHFWTNSERELVGTLHVQVSGDSNEQAILAEISSIFKSQGVKNFALQVEKEEFFSQSLVALEGSKRTPECFSAHKTRHHGHQHGHSHGGGHNHSHSHSHSHGSGH